MLLVSALRSKTCKHGSSSFIGGNSIYWSSHGVIQLHSVLLYLSPGLDLEMAGSFAG